MELYSRDYDPSLPPGTFLLIREDEIHHDARLLLLHPTPSNDPNDPLNWSFRRKVWAFALIQAVTIAVFSALSTQTNFWQQMAVDMDLSFEQLNNSLSANSAGCAMGCVLFIPFAKKYGRRSTYVVSTLVMAAVTWWCSRMKTLAELYVTNLFFGLAGATNETIVQMTIADIFFVHQRGQANALYMVAVMVGSFLVPMAAGLQASTQGWRASYIALAISLTVLSMLFIFSGEETKYIPVVSASIEPVSAVDPEEDQKDPSTNETAASTTRVQSSSSPSEAIPMHTYRQRMRWITKSPGSLWKMTISPIYIAFFPHVIFCSLQYATGVMWLIIMSSVISIVFSDPPYNFSTAGIGLLSLGPFVGNLIGSIYAGVLSDRTISWLAKRNKGYFEPEFRLYILALPTLCISGGTIMFGITVDRGMHWIYPSVAGALFAFGLGAIGDVSLTLVIDSYQALTGDAFISVAFFRNVLGIGISFAITPWMETSGLTWMFCVCGLISFFISLLFIPMIVYGKRIRAYYSPRYFELLQRSGEIHI